MDSNDGLSQGSQPNAAMSSLEKIGEEDSGSQEMNSTVKSIQGTNRLSVFQNLPSDDDDDFESDSCDVDDEVND